MAQSLSAPARCYYCARPAVVIELQRKPRRREVPECADHAPWLKDMLAGRWQYRQRAGLSPCCEMPVQRTSAGKVICDLCGTWWLSALEE